MIEAEEIRMYTDWRLRNTSLFIHTGINTHCMKRNCIYDPIAASTGTYFMMECHCQNRERIDVLTLRKDALATGDYKQDESYLSVTM